MKSTGVDEACEKTFCLDKKKCLLASSYLGRPMGRNLERVKVTIGRIATGESRFCL